MLQRAGWTRVAGQMLLILGDYADRRADAAAAHVCCKRPWGDSIEATGGVPPELHSRLVVWRSTVEMSLARHR